MHAIIIPSSPSSASHPSAPAAARRANAWREPHYDCADTADALRVSVYVPGVDVAGVELLLRGSDLEVTARKPHFVRVNWQALHLESAQRDYRLRLRLGRDFDFDRLHAELEAGVLVIEVPKRVPAGGAPEAGSGAAGAGELASPRARRLSRRAA